MKNWLQHLLQKKQLKQNKFASFLWKVKKIFIRFQIPTIDIKPILRYNNSRIAAQAVVVRKKEESTNGNFNKI